MICTASMSRLRDKKYDGFTKIAIVRSMRPSKTLPQLATLSPNWDLFGTYRDLKARGKWDERSFEKVYVPRFVEQMRNDPEAAYAIRRLADVSHDHDVVLACFCTDVRTCHRSIVASLLRDAGAEMGTIE